MGFRAILWGHWYPCFGLQVAAQRIWSQDGFMIFTCALFSLMHNGLQSHLWPGGDLNWGPVPCWVRTVLCSTLWLSFIFFPKKIKMKQCAETVARSAEYETSWRDIKSTCAFSVHFKYIWRAFHAVHHRVGRIRQTINKLITCDRPSVLKSTPYDWCHPRSLLNNSNIFFYISKNRTSSPKCQLLIGIETKKKTVKTLQLAVQCRIVERWVNKLMCHNNVLLKI